MPGAAEYGDVLAEMAVAGNIEVGRDLQVGNGVEIGMLMAMFGECAEKEGVDVFFSVFLGRQADIVQNQSVYSDACRAFIMEGAVQMQGALQPAVVVECGWFGMRHGKCYAQLGSCGVSTESKSKIVIKNSKF